MTSRRKEGREQFSTSVPSHCPELCSRMLTFLPSPSVIVLVQSHYYNLILIYFSSDLPLHHSVNFFLFSVFRIRVINHLSLSSSKFCISCPHLNLIEDIDQWNKVTELLGTPNSIFLDRLQTSVSWSLVLLIFIIFSKRFSFSFHLRGGVREG